MTVVPLQPTFCPVNNNAADTIIVHVRAVRNAEREFDDVRMRETKKFTLRGNISGADQISSKLHGVRAEKQRETRVES